MHVVSCSQLGVHDDCRTLDPVVAFVAPARADLERAVHLDRSDLKEVVKASLGATGANSRRVADALERRPELPVFVCMLSDPSERVSSAHRLVVSPLPMFS